MSRLIFMTLLLLWTTECTALTLTSSTSLIGWNGTQDFYLNCSTDDHPENQSQSEMVEIRSMRISKLESSRWRPVIEIDPDWKAPKVWGDLKSSFIIGAKGPTSLQVTWDLASNVTAGQYVCEVMSYTRNGRGAWQTSSTLYIDVEIPPTLHELLEMIQSSNRKLGTALKRIDIHKEKIEQIEFSETKLHNTVEEHEENFEKIGTDIKTINVSVLSSNITLRTAFNNININKEQIKQIEFNETKLHSAMEEHEENFETIGTDIKTINASVLASNRTLGTALNNIYINKERIKQIEVNETKLHNTMEEHEENIETIRSDIEMIKETVNQSSFDAVGLLQEHEKEFDRVKTEVELIKETVNQSSLDAIGLLEKLDKHIESFRTETEMIKENVTQTKESFDTYVKKMHDRNYWPQGSYAVLMPETGCPANDGVDWKTGWRKHHTQSGGQNHDEVSKPAHMKKPIIERNESSGDNFMTQHHCSVAGLPTAREWPAGSYCIMRNMKLECPIGFMSDGIFWDDEDTNNKNGPSGHYSAGFSNTKIDTWIYYCCRNDSSPSTPIHLPRSKPFYLYRFSDRCQQVHGMEVTPEFMFFDTNDDRKYNEKHVYVPDGSRDITDVKLELCYYE